MNQLHQLGLVFLASNLVSHLVGDRHDGARIVRQRSHGNENQVWTIGKAGDNLGSGLLPRELAEVLLDVLDFEGAALEGVLLDQIFQALIL